MLQVAVCDDMPEHTTHVLRLLSGYQESRLGVKFQTHSFSSANQLLSSITTGTRYDLYLLDIIMPDLDGIALARQIRQRDTDAAILFLTQSASYALDAFGVAAFQYILKPVAEDVFFSVLDKAIAARKHEEDRFFILSAPGRIINVLYSSIIMVEYAGRVLRFGLTSGEILESKSIRTSFGKAIGALLNDRRFLWFHQSFVINMTHVRELRGRAFVMRNGADIPIPKPKYAAAKKSLSGLFGRGVNEVL
jgi:DNA-binding LytR/AlgR family response regulator